MAKRPNAKSNSPRTPRQPAPQRAANYAHPTAELLVLTEVGTQPQFRKKKPPKSYRFDSSLSPELNWDGRGPTRRGRLGKREASRP